MTYQTRMGRYLKTSGLDLELEKFIQLASGIFLALSLLGIVAYFLLGPKYFLITIGLAFLAEGVMHYSLVSLSKKRAAIAEEMLPDALRLIASNLRAGIIPEKAFIDSARPEFGPLSLQIKEAGKAMMLGSQIKHAFMKIPEKIDSDLLRKTVNLIAEGIGRGANLSSLLDGLADDMKSTMMLKKDIKAQVASYSMFIMLAIGIGAPILFSASLFLVETLIGLGSILPSESLNAGGISLSFTGLLITKEFLLYYQIGLMCVSSLFGAILIGLISEGKEFAGIRYIPILLTMNLALFYFVKFTVLANFSIF
ncbi:MAG: type II secretion system F family protein [Candidatus Aenigmarchaeota archaeon]|nr:type II secretion system F family protein [Candidatus Aenigmarchaeota archaeon]